MDLLSFLKSEARQRRDIIERLISKGHVSAKEAAILLTQTNHVHIEKLEMSSGAKVVAGDDNEQTYR